MQDPILIVGGGIAGMSTAIMLARGGIQVELIESDAQWKVYGAGITITGPTYRAFDALGLLDELHSQGFGARGGTRICTATGDLISEVAGIPLREGLPPIGGIMRPKLHEILSRCTLSSGVAVRLGLTYREFKETAEGVQVTFTDGSQRRFRAVIVADGAFSKTRHVLFPDAPKPHYTGQYCWRLVAERHREIDRAYIYMGGAVYAGLVPTSETSMYLWLLETRPEKFRVEAEDQYLALAALMKPFDGLLGKLRDELSSDSVINCRPLDAILLPRPWYRGRILLIGDAAHSTTPHLASGAGIAVEDALMLSHLLSRQSTTIEQAFSQFMDRRWARCKDVVESSVEIGALQQSGASPAKYGALIGAAESRLRVDIWDSASASSVVNH